MVTFPDEINPKYGLKVRFDYSPRATQYLEFFKITTGYPTFKFIPLNLTFQSSNELYQFLINKGIIYDEVDIYTSDSKVEKRMTVVDTNKIYEVEENISKYLLNYKYYSINEVAEILSFSRPTVYNLVNNQTIKAIRINGKLRINHLDLIAFINKESQR
jgi:excisionase family DNA binding protein